LYSELENGTMNRQIDNPIGLDALKRFPQNRGLTPVQRAYGKIEVTYDGLVPAGETVTISKQSGTIIQQLSADYYKPTTLGVYNSGTLNLSMTGTPIRPSSAWEIIVRPSFDTRVLMYIPFGR
jgi:hypothetical protein